MVVPEKHPADEAAERFEAFARKNKGTPVGVRAQRQATSLRQAAHL